jgi:hypothetical protein
VSFTPLLTAIHVRKISTFSRGVLALLLSKSRDSSTARLDAEVTYRILRTRMIPETEAISGPGAAETRGHLIRVILELMCVDSVKDIANWATTAISTWYIEAPEWKLSFEQRLQQLVGDECLPRIAKSVSDTLRSDHRLLKTIGQSPSRSYQYCLKYYLTMYESL